MPETSDVPSTALSIQQPWAWLIVNGHKTIENRTWRTTRRGRIAIHAGLKIDTDCRAALHDGLHPVSGEDEFFGPPETHIYSCGGIVGTAEIVDCIDRSDDPFFEGPFGFVLANAKPVEFIPVRGALGFFSWHRYIKDEL